MDQPPAPVSAPASAASEPTFVSRAWAWARAHRAEILLFAFSYCVLAGFSGERFLRQSAAPHFIYQAQAWLDGRVDIDPKVLPNIEDWACVRVVDGQKVRCTGPVRSADEWYVSFPAFPSVAMLPFVAVNGYQFNDTSFGVFVGALAILFFFQLLQMLSERGESTRTKGENAFLALTLGFGTLFFYCAIRGEVWFSAEVMGVALTCLYLRFAVGARRPILAGLLFSMATLTRAPLVFTGIFFFAEAICPGPTGRLAQLKAFFRAPKAPLRKIGLFVAGALPLAMAAMVYNAVRFGGITEFGHGFLYDNRVNADIDRWGLFNLHYLARNLHSAFLTLPKLSFHPFRLGYDPHGLSLLLTLPILVLLFFPKVRSRLSWPLWLAAAACALPGFLYQNDGYAQFGFRFSLDYTPYLLLLFALGGWQMKKRWVAVLLGVGFVVSFWGAVAFSGYTELVRGW